MNDLRLPETADQLLRREEVCELCGFQKSKLYSMVQSGNFPKPMKIGGVTRWSTAEIAHWQRSLPRGVAVKAGLLAYHQRKRHRRRKAVHAVC